MGLLSRARLKPIAAFCYVWLMLGFFVGTLVLLGPVRWLTAGMRQRGYQQGTEDLAVLGIIAVYVLVTAAFAFLIVRWTGQCRTRGVRLGVPLALTLAAVLSLWGWANPAALAGAAPLAGSRIATGGAEFVFGPYPERARLEALKREGFTAVISLQHPAVMPFEPAGIAAEQAAAKDIGLEFIHAPMLPWVSSNDASLNRIREIARKGSGRFYVHCGLGRDRVNLVKRMLEREGSRVATGEGYVEPRTLAQRVAEGRPPFERGAIREVEPDVWLLPYPNKHEFFGNLLAGQVKHITLALDPDDPEQANWTAEAERLLKQYDIPHEVQPFTGADAARARAIVDRTRQAPKPAVVIVPYTAPQPSTEAATAILAAFDTDQPQ